MHISKEKNNNNNQIKNEIKGTEPIHSTKMKNLYKAIKEEIKNIVITKLHNQIKKLVYELDKVKKEKKIIKNDLVYILKRILNNKTEYNTLNQNINNFRNNSCINLNSNNNNFANSSTITLNKSKNSVLSSEKTINNNIKNNRNTSHTKISIIKTQDNLGNILDSETSIKSDKSKYYMDKNKYKNIDNKIDGYLNSLYKHNFVGNHIGYENSYNLNKPKGLFDELFCTQSSVYENTNNHNLPKKARISVDDKNQKMKSNSTKKIKSENNRYKNINYNKYNHRKKNEKYKTILVKKEESNLNNSFSCKKNKIKRDLTNSCINKNENSSSGNNDLYGKKSNSKIKIIYTNRSPFIANKF